ncbi:MAG: hypothetical protein ACT4OE_11180 [Sphingosinicella sp.]
MKRWLGFLVLAWLWLALITPPEPMASETEIGGLILWWFTLLPLALLASALTAWFIRARQSTETPIFPALWMLFALAVLGWGGGYSRTNDHLNPQIIPVLLVSAALSVSWAWTKRARTD